MTPLLAVSAGLFAAGGSVAAPTALTLPGGRADQRVIVVFRNQLSALPASVASIGARRRSVETDQAPIVDALRAAGTSQVHSYATVNALSATISLAAERALRTDPAVAEVISDAVLHDPAVSRPGAEEAAAATAAATGGQAFCAAPGAPAQLTPQALALTNTDSTVPGARTARSLGFTGAGVKVAFMAEGVDVDNPDFVRADGSHVFVDYKDFSGDGLDAPTTGGEAFLDSSAIAAQGRQTYDVSHYTNHPLAGPCRIRIEGVAPGASLVGLKIFATQHVTYESGFLQAIDYAVAVDHVDVLNESFGGNPFPDTTQDVTKIFNDQAVAAGTTVTVSSGDSSPANTIGSPSSDPKVIAVGATTSGQSSAQTDSYFGQRFVGGVSGFIDNNIASFSSAGVTQSGRTVDLVAPGAFNWALCTPDPKQYADCVDGNGNPASVANEGGTSQSSPLTAGAAALVIQAYRRSHHGASPAPALVKTLLTSTATDISAPGDQQGTGLLNSYKAVLAALSAPGSTHPKVGRALLTSTDQLDVAQAPATVVHRTLTLTNDGSGTEKVNLSTRAVGTYRTLARKTVVLSPTSGHEVVSGTHTDTYQLVTFKVPAGLDRLDAAVAYKSNSSAGTQYVVAELIDPHHRVAGDTDVESSPSNYGDFQVAHPVAGIWTAVIYARGGAYGGTTGPVVFQASGARFVSLGTVSPTSVTIRAGHKASVTYTATTGSTPGDSSAAVVLTTSADHVASVSTVAVVLRSVAPVTVAARTFSGTFTGGNGRSPVSGFTAYVKLQVPAGLPELNSVVQLSGNRRNPFTAYLVNPTGQALAFAASQLPVGLDSSGNLIAADVRSAQLHVLKPVAGRWTLIVNFAPTVSGTAVSQRYTVETDGHPVVAAATGLPTSAKTKIPTGRTRTVRVRVHNSGSAPEAFFLDPRRNASVTYSLAVSPAAVKLPDTGENGEPLFLVPTDTTRLDAKLTASGPATFDFSYLPGDPDITASTRGTTATGSATGSPLSPGIWVLGPSEIGPFGTGVPPTVTGTVSVRAKTAMFDPTMKSSTGDLWLEALNPKAEVDPVLVLPGQTKTIVVKITPTGKAGTTVGGTLYVDDITEVSAGELTLGGQQVAALPYRYTIG